MLFMERLETGATLAEKRVEEQRFRLIIAVRCAGRAGILCPPGPGSQELAESANEVGESLTKQQFAE
jgi:hypothetical protein